MRLCKSIEIPPHHVRVFCPRAWSRCWCGNLCNSDLVVGLFLVALLISSFLGPFSHLQDPCGSLCMALQRQTARMGRRLVGIACQRVSEEFVQGACQEYTRCRLEAIQGGMLKRLAALRQPGCRSTARPKPPWQQPGLRQALLPARAGQPLDQGGSFGSPLAAYFDPEHNQAAATCPPKFGIGLASFEADGLGKDDAGMGMLRL